MGKILVDEDKLIEILRKVEDLVAELAVPEGIEVTCLHVATA